MKRWLKTCYGVLLITVLQILSGCSESEVTQPVTNSISLEGRVYSSSGYEDIYENGSAVEDAFVSVYSLRADGALMLLKESTKTDFEGKFIVQAELSVNQEYLLTASKGNLVRKAYIKAAPQDEITMFVQPLTSESTIEADVYILAKQKGYQVTYYDISLLIDSKIADLMTEKPELMNELTDVINISIQARASAFINNFFGGTSSALIAYNNEADILQIKYARDLHFAPTGKSIRNINSNYYESYFDAMTTTGIAEEKVIKLFEIYYRIFLKNKLSDIELKLNLIKSIAYFKAKISNVCNTSDFQRIKGGSGDKSIREAASELLNLIKSADDYENIRISFNNYNGKVLKSLVKAAGINENLKENIEQKIYTGLTKLNSDFNLAADPEAVIQAFISYYEGVTSEVKSLLKNMYREESDILAEMLIMLYINF